VKCQRVEGDKVKAWIRTCRRKKRKKKHYGLEVKELK
jgi:hypothetical protein